tara:strand:+ start:199 stop:648 length:450 start_codon:yes stop_codon:yes gene_type:complete
MIKSDIFKNIYIDILHPFHLENLWQLVKYVENKTNNLKPNELKEITLKILTFLLNEKLIYILENNFMYNKDFKRTHLSNTLIMQSINEKWTSSISDDDLYNLAWFKFEDWYINKLSEKGLNIYTMDWNKFLEDNIGDLEQWINHNRPKN